MVDPKSPSCLIEPALLPQQKILFCGSEPKVADIQRNQNPAAKKEVTAAGRSVRVPQVSLLHARHDFQLSGYPQSYYLCFAGPGLGQACLISTCEGSLYFVARMEDHSKDALDEISGKARPHPKAGAPCLLTI
jgi:hypothetical protein